MNEAEFAVAQRGLRARVADELVGSVQTLERDRRSKVSELDQEALTFSLVNAAIADFARTCFDAGRPGADRGRGGAPGPGGHGRPVRGRAPSSSPTCRTPRWSASGPTTSVPAGSLTPTAPR